MGWLSDWLDAENRVRDVRARFPDCTGQADCPADEHPIDCIKAHREWRAAHPLPPRVET